MSRTDKDKPYWVAATWYEPLHTRGCPYVIGGWQRGAPRDCDLPKDATRTDSFWPRWRIQQDHCRWVPHWDHALYRTYGHYSGSVPRWFIRHHYHCPERVRSRDVLRAAVKDWNANGETDLEPQPRQARSSARRNWF